MARFAGTAMVITFGGTTLSALFQSAEWTEEQATIDVTAGADTHVETLFTDKNDNISMTILSDSQASGTALYDAVAPGSSGTLIIYPTGTAAGNAIHTWTDAKVVSRSHTVPRADRAEISVEFVTDVVEAVTIAA